MKINSISLAVIVSICSVVVSAGELEKATFAGGCFWCMEKPFEKLKGVNTVISGYMGGEKMNPTYKDVSSGKSGHLEVVQIEYNPKIISYNDLLEVFWRNVNPTDGGGQFVDRGPQYETRIFFHTQEQKKAAKTSKKNLEKSKRFKNKIVTSVQEAKTFYPAEDYHQDYYKKNPIRYKIYRYNSGRDQFLDKIWGKDREFIPHKIAVKIEGSSYIPPVAEKIKLAKENLTPLQYRVTQEDGTEQPFKNKYWKNKDQGIYVDIVSGEPLFSSLDKFDSGTGWPSFTKTLVKKYIVEKEDNTLFMKRTEVRSKVGNSHLGHVFDDGPPPTGLRYCINSASLKFIPLKDLKKEGYSEFEKLFKK